MLTKNGEELQLGDFGLSQVQMHTAKSIKTVDSTGFPAYLAPEIIKLPVMDSTGNYALKQGSARQRYTTRFFSHIFLTKA